jgi:hypothetical protein
LNCQFSETRWASAGERTIGKPKPLKNLSSTIRLCCGSITASPIQSLMQREQS